MVSRIGDLLCKCGHESQKHRGYAGKCTIPACCCGAFSLANLKKSKQIVLEMLQAQQGGIFPSNIPLALRETLPVLVSEGKIYLCLGRWHLYSSLSREPKSIRKQISERLDTIEESMEVIRALLLQLPPEGK